MNFCHLPTFNDLISSYLADDADDDNDDNDDDELFLLKS